jgi:hypothetical protein
VATGDRRHRGKPYHPPCPLTQPGLKESSATSCPSADPAPRASSLPQLFGKVDQPFAAKWCHCLN